MNVIDDARRIVEAQTGVPVCLCGTRAYPHLDPKCHNELHRRLAALDVADAIQPSAQGDGDPSPMRMTLAEPTVQKVWLFWRNDVLLGVFGSESRAWVEVKDFKVYVGGDWTSGDAFGRVWVNDFGVTLRMEPREVHR